MSQCIPRWIYPTWDSVLSGVCWLFPFPCQGIFQLLSFQIFSQVLSLSSPSGTSIMLMLVHLMLSHGLLGCLHFFFFPFFFLYSVLWQWFRPFCLPDLFFCVSYSAMDSFQCIVHLCLFFSSPRSLVNISCIFSILFLRSWIIFTIIILNFFFSWKVAYLHFI